MVKQPALPSSFEIKLDELAADIDLAAHWGMPTIVLAVYENTFTGAKSVSDLEARLIQQGQHVCHIAPDADGKNNIIAEITRNNHWEETVFFIMHQGCGIDENVYQTLTEHSDFFVNNHIRVVYWLTTSDFIDYVQHSPEYWFLQHKLVEFSTSSGWNHVLPRIINRTWQNFDGTEKDEVLNFEDIPLIDLLSLDVRDDLDGLVKRAHLLIKLGIFYFHQDDYPISTQFLAKAMEIAQITGNEQFSIASQIAFALIQTELDQYDDAVFAQKKMQSTLPENSDTWNNLARLYFALYMFDEAMSAYQMALSTSHEDPISWHGLGEVHLQFGQLDKAIDAFHKAILAAPNFANAWKGLGKAYTAANNHPKAVECYTKSLRIDHRQADIWFEVGCIAKDDIAKGALQHALELDHTHTYSWNMLGNIYYRAEKFNKAIRAYYQAIQLKKDFGWPYANMALIYTQRKQYNNAIPLYVKSVQLLQGVQEKVNILYKLGNAYAASGKYSNAVRAYREAGQLHKGSNLLDKNLLNPGPFRGWISTRVDGEHTPGDNKFDDQPAEELDTSSHIQVDADAKLRKTKKNALLHKVLESNKNADNVDYWLELGSFYVRNHMYELAEDALLIAIELDPSNGWSYYNLAMANTVNGFYREAVPLYEKSIRLFSQGQDKALCWNQLGNVYRRLNEPSLAVAAYEQARVLNPKKSSAISRARLSLMSNCYAK